MRKTVNEIIVENSSKSKGVFLRFPSEVMTEHKEYTYQQFYNSSLDWLALYSKNNISRKEIVLILFDPSLNQFSSYVGAILGGLRPAMIATPSIKFSEDNFIRDLKHILETTGAKHIVTFTGLKNIIINHLGKELTILTPRDIENGAGDETIIAQASEDDIAFIQFSSGTTGAKKGVEISHKALIWQVENYCKAINYGEDDSIGSWLPLYHDMGLICCLFIPILTGTQVSMVHHIKWVQDPVLILRIMSFYRHTFCWLPNFAFNFLSQNCREDDLSELDLSLVKGFVNCSEPVMPSSVKLFLKRMSVCSLKDSAAFASYAMAENTFAVTSADENNPVNYIFINDKVFVEDNRIDIVSPVHPSARLIASSGKALPGHDIIIVDKKRNKLRDGEVGEIGFSSPCMLTDYLNNDKATAESVKDGYYYSADTGFLLDEHLYVIGRNSDTIIIAGKNIYPQDIEFVVNEVKGIVAGRSVCFGVFSEASGTEKLVVIAETKDEKADKIELQHRVFDAVSAGTEFSPDEVYIVDHMWLKKSTSGKISRKLSKNKYLDEISDDCEGENSAVKSLDSLSEQVITIIVNIINNNTPFKLKSLALEDKLITSGRIDSLTLVHLVVELEKAFGLRINTADMNLCNFETVDAVINLVTRLKSGTNSESRSDIMLGSGAQEINIKMNGIESLKAVPDVIVLGSSRSLPISSVEAERFGLTLYNSAVSVSRISDWYCFLRFFEDKHNKLPDNLIVGVDLDRFMPLESVCATNSDILKKYLTEIDGGETGTSCTDSRWDQVRMQFRMGLFIPDDKNTRKFASDTGDMLSRNDFYQSGRPESRVEISKAAEKEAVLSHMGYCGMDANSKLYFKAIVALCRKYDCRLTVFIPPMHSSVVNVLSQEVNIDVIRSDIKDFISKIGFEKMIFKDMLEVESFDGLQDDFFDVNHFGYANADLILKKLLLLNGYKEIHREKKS